MVQTHQAPSAVIPSSQTPPHAERRPDLLIILGLLAAGLLVYAQTIAHAFIPFDDPDYVTRNAHVKAGLTWEGWRWAWTSLEYNNWHPLTWLSLMLDAQFYGLNAGGYHLTNLLLHLLDGVLLFVWLRQGTGRRWPSALVAFFFVAHPLHVESVAWVTERKDVLSTLFFFLTLLAYTRYAQRGGVLFYWLALGSFAVGLTAKPMLVTLPPLLLLLDFWPLRRTDHVSFQRLLTEKLPFAVLMVASCVVTVLAQRATAMVPLASLPVSYRLAASASGYGFYLWKTVAPFRLGVFYPYGRPASWAGPTLWAAALATGTWAAFRLRRSRPYLLVGWGWFVGMLVPVIGVVQVGGQATADRYAYLPHVGLFVAVFFLGAEGWQRASPPARRVLVALGLVAGLGALALSYRQAGYWRSGTALFARSINVVDRPNAKLYRMLGDAEVEAGHPAEAAAAYERSSHLGGNSNDLLTPFGTLLLREERWQEAARVLAPVRNRTNATADLLNNLAYAQSRNGQEDEALLTYRLCTERFPRFALARFGWAGLLQRRGDLAEACAQDEAGLSIQADYLPALLRLAWNYSHSTDGQVRAFALGLAERAAVVGNQELGSLNVLAFAQAANGHWPEAVETASRALATAKSPGAPENATAVCTALLARYQQGQLPD